jgi:hypothetical protein
MTKQDKERKLKLIQLIIICEFVKSMKIENESLIDIFYSRVAIKCWWNEYLLIISQPIEP